MWLGLVVKELGGEMFGGRKRWKLRRHMWSPLLPPHQVLETCVKNCGHRFHILVANRDFIDGVLVKILSPRNNPPTIVQDKVLALIQVGQLLLAVCGPAVSPCAWPSFGRKNGGFWVSMFIA